MKDALIDRLESWLACNPGVYDWIKLHVNETREILAALRGIGAGEPVGEVVIGPKGDVEGWTVVKWVEKCPPVGTKLYAHAAPATDAVAVPREPTREDLLDAKSFSETLKALESILERSERDGIVRTDEFEHEAITRAKESLQRTYAAPAADAVAVPTDAGGDEMNRGDKPCHACPDGNEWNSNGPTGRACRVCKGHAVLMQDGSPITGGGLSSPPKGKP